MKDLFVGLSLASTALAAVVSAVFEFCLDDTTKLQDKLVREGKAKAGDAKQQAQSRRKKQKLVLLGLALLLALIFSVLALVAAPETA